jgi:hypothetical protein
MSVPHLPTGAALVLAQGYALTPGRFWSLAAGLLALAAAVVGGLALARTGTGTRRAVVALAAGATAAVVGGLVVATADGGPGSGSGIVGGAVALLVGLVAMALGGLAMARTRRVTL